MKHPSKKNVFILIAFTLCLALSAISCCRLDASKARTNYLISHNQVVPAKTIKLESFLADYQQNFPIPTDKAIGLNVNFENSKIPLSGGRTYLEVGLQAAKEDSSEGMPLNLNLVIDRSGSMGKADKLNYVRQAAEMIVRRLTPRDYFSLSIYNQDAETPIESRTILESDKEELISYIKSISADGRTNLHGGLMLAYKECGRHFSDDRVNHVILLSDGLANVGVTDPKALADIAKVYSVEGTITSTVGVGLDFNEDLMLAVAEAGMGNYYFIDTPERIVRAFDEELQELLRIVAKKVSLRIKLAPSVKLVKLFGHEPVIKDGAMVIELGTMYSGEHRIVMMELELPGRQGAEVKVADVSLSSEDIIFKQQAAQQKQAVVSYTGDAEEIEGSLNAYVKKNRLGLETGEALKEAALLMESGQNARAVKRVGQQREAMEQGAASLESPELRKDADLLKKYETTLAALGKRNVSRSAEGKYLRKQLQFQFYKKLR